MKSEQMKYATAPELSKITLATVMQALADPCRQQIVLTLLASDGRALACNEFDLNVSKATASHHFDTLRKAGIIASCNEGTRCLSTLRTVELEARFPGLLMLLQAELAGSAVFERPPFSLALEGVAEAVGAEGRDQVVGGFFDVVRDFE